MGQTTFLPCELLYLLHIYKCIKCELIINRKNSVKEKNDYVLTQYLNRLIIRFSGYRYIFLHLSNRLYKPELIEIYGTLISK